MGTWQLEIGKMFLYMAFPVSLFHYFNQPQNFEQWVIRIRQECFPPDTEEKRQKIEKFIQEFNERKSLEAER